MGLLIHHQTFRRINDFSNKTLSIVRKLIMTVIREIEIETLMGSKSLIKAGEKFLSESSGQESSKSFF